MSRHGAARPPMVRGKAKGGAPSSLRDDRFPGRKNDDVARMRLRLADGRRTDRTMPPFCGRFDTPTSPVVVVVVPDTRTLRSPLGS
jgi:hypothetical protein